MELYELQQYIEYKARLSRIEVIYINIARNVDIKSTLRMGKCQICSSINNVFSLINGR